MKKRKPKVLHSREGHSGNAISSPAGCLLPDTSVRIPEMLGQPLLSWDALHTSLQGASYTRPCAGPRGDPLFLHPKKFGFHFSAVLAQVPVPVHYANKKIFEDFITQRDLRIVILV